MAQELFGCLGIGQVIPPPGREIYSNNRNLRHPVWCAETDFSQLAHGLNNYPGLPRQLNAHQNERADNQKGDKKSEQNRCDRWPYAFADQPFANRPCCESQDTCPCKRGQEAPQDPNRRENQDRQEYDAADQLQRRLLHKECRFDLLHSRRASSKKIDSSHHITGIHAGLTPSRWDFPSFMVGLQAAAPHSPLLPFAD